MFVRCSKEGGDGDVRGHVPVTVTMTPEVWLRLFGPTDFHCRHRHCVYALVTELGIALYYARLHLRRPHRHARTIPSS